MGLGVAALQLLVCLLNGQLQRIRELLLVLNLWRDHESRGDERHRNKETLWHLLLLRRLQNAHLSLAHVVGAVELNGQMLVLEFELLVVLRQL